VKIFNNPGAYYAMAAISPALLFVPVMSVFRGYFQGMQEMLPTAASQLIEQAVRVSVSLILAVALVPKGIKIAAAGGSLGTSAGPVAGVLALTVIYLIRRGGVRSRIMKDQNPERVKAGELLKTLAALAIPTTIGVSILPIMNIVDVLISMGRMQAAGFSEQEANSLYGLMSGFAAPIINIPMSLALSIALSLVPAVAAAKSTEDRGFLDTNIRMGLRTAMLIGVPCSFGLMLLARPIMMLIYPMKAESAAGAAACLAILGGGVIFLSVAQTMAGILQGLGKASLPVISLLAGVALKTVFTWFLAAVPSLNIDGAALGSTFGYLVIALLNLYYVKKLTNINFDIKLSVLKPLACGAVMGVAVTAVYYALAALLGGSLSCLLAICAGAAVYVAAVFKIGAIQTDEFSLISASGRLAAVFKRIKSWNGK
jgi:stage V sporulation protein B